MRAVPTETPTEGVGTVEAPRGTLTHHYWTDENGVITRVNLIVGTTNNNAAIHMVTKKVASTMIKPGVEPDQGVLNLVEPPKSDPRGVLVSSSRGSAKGGPRWAQSGTRQSRSS